MAHATNLDAGFVRPFATQSFIARIRRTFAERALYRRTIDELRSLSDRDLADLGLHRHEIGRVAHESVYGA